MRRASDDIDWSYSSRCRTSSRLVVVTVQWSLVGAGMVPQALNMVVEVTTVVVR